MTLLILSRLCTLQGVLTNLLDISLVLWKRLVNLLLQPFDPIARNFINANNALH